MTVLLFFSSIQVSLVNARCHRRLTDLVQETENAFCVHLLGSHEIETTLPRADRSIFVAEFPKLGKIDYWPVGGQRPTRSGIAHPSKAGFVLKHQRQRKKIFAFQANVCHPPLRRIFWLILVKEATWFPSSLIPRHGIFALPLCSGTRLGY